MDLSGVLWIGGARREVADEVGRRIGIAVRWVDDDAYTTFRALLAELEELDARRLIVSGRLPAPAVAAVLRREGQAVFVGDDHDARTLRLPRLAADASAADVIAAIDTSP